jgi:23S rRNA (cytidine1920-2'-O)/16S rRNA (cytidine1409-2'-O)-methyltransferase
VPLTAKPTSRQRLDVELVERGLAPSRQRAQALIMAGQVRVNQVPVDKPGALIRVGDNVDLQTPDHPYVSRGGLKLARGLSAFSIDPGGKVCLDVGASTGGFTDCLLQHGAQRVYAVDVGYGQMAWKLRQDQRVIIIERTNIRYLPEGAVPEPVDLAAVDVSFISLKIVMPIVARLMKAEASALVLIKPQFEVGKGHVGKGGVVKDPGLHAAVIEDLQVFLVASGFLWGGVVESPIQGPKGNREFIAWLRRR